MTIKITVPSLGESISSAVIAKWHKKKGDIVEVDEIIVELETEKIALAINSPASGILENITKQEGDTVELGEIIGEVKEEVIKNNLSDENNINNNSKKTQITETQNIQENKFDHVNKEIIDNDLIAPSAKKIIIDNDLKIEEIKATGRDERITKYDVLTAISNKSNMLKENKSQLNLEKKVKMSPLRKTIAARLKASQNTAAILTTFNEINMQNIIKMREIYKDAFIKKHEIKLGFMSFFIKAACHALQNIPVINAQIDNEEIIYKYYYNIGVAIGSDRGLIVPTIKECDKLSFAQIEKSISLFSEKAKNGSLNMEDLSDATFSISNGGTYGSLLSTPIISPPQSAILGLHKIEERPVVINGEIKIMPMMYVALSYDHRLIDGKEAVSFLVKIKEMIENPERLLLDI